jgi:hypothetical protein
VVTAETLFSGFNSEDATGNDTEREERAKAGYGLSFDEPNHKYSKNLLMHL